jgi:hypothetical protein
MEKFDTFISYNSKDVDYVESIYRTLKIANLNIFFDKKNLGLGDDNLDILTDALETCNNFLVFISNEKGPWQSVRWFKKTAHFFA